MISNQMIKSPVNPDYVTRYEFEEFKGFVSDGFDKMEDLITNSKIEVIGTLTNVIDEKIKASESRILERVSYEVNGKIAESEKRILDTVDGKIIASEKRILTKIDKINGTIGNLNGRVGLIETQIKRLETKTDIIIGLVQSISSK